MFDEHGANVNMKTVSFKVFINEGYRENLTLLEDMKNTSDDILDTEIHLLVDYYWSKSYFKVVLNSLLYIFWSILLLLNLFMFNTMNNSHHVLIKCTIAYSIILLLREIVHFHVILYRNFYKEIGNTLHIIVTKWKIRLTYPFWYLAYFYIYFKDFNNLLDVVSTSSFLIFSSNALT